MDTGKVAALAGVFAQVTDPRKARGVRHRRAAVLTVLTLALLCGARNFRQAANRVAQLPQSPLVAAGARWHPVLGVRVPPGRDTLRRLVEAVDATVVDCLVCGGLAARLDTALGCGLAIDGKTVRNSGGGHGVDVQLFSAMRHDTAVTVAQVRVPADTTEVTQITALLGPTGMDRRAVLARPHRHPHPTRRPRPTRHLATRTRPPHPEEQGTLAAAMHTDAGHHRALFIHETTFQPGDIDLDAPGALAEVHRRLALDEPRNTQIADDIAAALARESNRLVLTRRVAQVEVLTALLAATRITARYPAAHQAGTPAHRRCRI
ncbi:transposase family protein [Micromonospora andamanensis]|uniref:transposase family protein n=1 Tax=Micromonospora andamanensis TaxID=1287068 RepID=UPI00194FD8F2|nr:transposase family protein [Micromonospora andamanensis]